MNPTNVAEQEVDQEKDEASSLPENTFKVSRTIKEGGEERKAEGTYHLPLAKNFVEMQNISANEDEAVYWFNFGRKSAARQQVFMALANPYADDKINELNKAFNEAVDQMLAGSNDPVKKKRYTDYILGEEQFAPLVAAMKESKDAKPHFDFSTIEIKRPGDKPGPKAKS